MKRAGLWMMIILCLSLVAVNAVMAQSDDDACPVIVQQALQSVDDLCALTGRNEACYGNLSLSATPRDGAAGFTFEAPGDVVGIGEVRSIRLQAMDIDGGTWGVALLRVQANIPATLPGQNVTFLLFGDVEFQPGGSAYAVAVTASGSMNVRGGPGTNYAIVTTLAAGDTVQASGQNNAGDWLLITLPDGGRGWVFAPLVTVDGDATGLEVVDADVGIMQAYYFRSGIGDAPCTAAPESGLLLRTPEGVGEIELLINEVRFSISSTIFVQAVPGGDMVVAVIEGEVTVFVAGVGITIHAGESVRIPLDSDGRPVGPPGTPAPFDPASIEPLPVTIVKRDTGYVGTWQSLDIDGSTQILRIWLNAGIYQVEWYDEGATICGLDDSGAPIHAVTLTGTGSVLATGGLSTNFSGTCHDGDSTAVGPFVIPFTYDRATDTLYDGTLTWYRAG
jgi:hypothetical protein